jgi:CMP-N,N'-diacetyllegionaminic acid synthase
MKDLPTTTDKKVLAIIPARGGSKRIPSKNTLELGGQPLLSYTLKQALKSKYINEIIVSTDCQKISELSKSLGVKVIIRPTELSKDACTSESALLHALDHRNQQGLEDPDTVVFLQCTSPLRDEDDIDNAIETFYKNKLDSLFSACKNNRLFWGVKDNKPFSFNYNIRTRLREQEMEVQWNENGSIYVIDTNILRHEQNRLGGKIGIYEMDYWNSFQIDEEDHLHLLEWIIQKRNLK